MARKNPVDRDNPPRFVNDPKQVVARGIGIRNGLVNLPQFKRDLVALVRNADGQARCLVLFLKARSLFVPTLFYRWMALYAFTV